MLRLLVLALCLLAASPVRAQLLISEVVSNNATSVLDEEGEAPDWIEVYNAGDEAVDLAGYALSDDPDAPRRWVFPSRTLQAGAHLLVFASGKEGLPLHSTFRLDAGGETVTLSSPDGDVLDEVDVPALPADVSFGRVGASSWAFFSPPSPRMPNGAGYVGITTPPALSPEPGWFDGPIDISVLPRHEEEVLRYTRDGSVPTEASPVVDGPLSLSETGAVRVRAFREGYVPGATVSGTYLLGEHPTLPVAAMIAPPPDLFSRSRGILNEFNLYRHDLEAPAHLAIYEPGAAAASVSFDAGAQLHGGFSRRYAQKSVALIARERYGQDAIEGAPFPDLPFDEYQALVLRNSGQDWYLSMMRDGLMHTLVRETHIDGQAYRPMAFYLNGEYWGLLNLRERQNEHYFAQHHGHDEDELAILQVVWNLEEPSAIQGDIQPYVDLLDYVETRDPLTDEDLEYAEARVDFDNFIDYHAARIYFSTHDWPGNNVKVWRPDEEGGRWRWALFDTDSGFGFFGPDDVQANTLAFATDPNGQTPTNLPRTTLLLRRLLSAEAFRDRFANRFADLLNTVFAPDSVVATVDRLASVIAPEIPRHQGRWPESASDWGEQPERLRAFGRQRPAFVREHLQDGFGLGPPTALTLQVAGSGRVRVQSVSPTQFPWTGTYFARLPVEIEAVPDVGHRFVRWSDDFTTPKRWVDPAISDIEAVFEPAVGEAQAVVINEIMYNPAEGSDSEDWVELVNTGDVTLDLSGWVLSDEEDVHQFAIPSGTALAPDDYLVLCRDASSFALVYPDAPPCLGDWDFGLSGGGDQVRLFDAAGLLVDSLAFDDEDPWPTLADGTGKTLELLSTDLDNSLPSNWRASTTAGGTPGEVNSVTTDGEEGPETRRLTLSAPAPNPFRTRTTLRFTLPSLGPVEIAAFDVLGREVARLVDGIRPAGTHEEVFDSDGLAAGVYVLRLVTREGAVSRRITKVE